MGGKAYNYVLEMSLSCDEYLPDFLMGKLNKKFSYNTCLEASFEALSVVNMFIEWMKTDTSCDTAPKLEVVSPSNVINENGKIKTFDSTLLHGPFVWKVIINGGDATFEIKVFESEVGTCLT